MFESYSVQPFFIFWGNTKFDIVKIPKMYKNTTFFLSQKFIRIFQYEKDI